MLCYNIVCISVGHFVNSTLEAKMDALLRFGARVLAVILEVIMALVALVAPLSPLGRLTGLIVLFWSYWPLAALGIVLLFLVRPTHKLARPLMETLTGIAAVLGYWLCPFAFAHSVAHTIAIIYGIWLTITVIDCIAWPAMPKERKLGGY